MLNGRKWKCFKYLCNRDQKCNYVCLILNQRLNLISTCVDNDDGKLAIVCIQIFVKDIDIIII